MGNWPRCELYRIVTIISLSLFDLIRGSKTQRLNVVSSLTLKWKRGFITKRLKSNYSYNCFRREKRWCNEIPMQQELLSSYPANSGSFRIMAVKARTVLHLSMLPFIYLFSLVRLMSTVLVYFFVRCPSVNYQILKYENSKSQWWQTVYFELLSDDVWKQTLRLDQVWKN